MKMMEAYVVENGSPRSIYTDRGSVYYAEEGVTDFIRALGELGCKAIIARSAQAKGRVERGNRTFQDRLVKALRKKGISSIGEANKFLAEVFIPKYNKKFAVFPEAPDVHFTVDKSNLKNIFCYKTEHYVKNDYTITLDGTYVQLLKGETPLP